MVKGMRIRQKSAEKKNNLDGSRNEVCNLVKMMITMMMREGLIFARLAQKSLMMIKKTSPILKLLISFSS